MASRRTGLTILRKDVSDSRLVRHALRKAIWNANGNVEATARHFKTSARSVRRWLTRLDLWDYLEEVRAERGPEHGLKAYWLPRTYSKAR